MDDIDLRRKWNIMQRELIQIRSLLEHLVDPTIMHYGDQLCAGCDVKIREEELRHVRDETSEEDWQEAERRSGTVTVPGYSKVGNIDVDEWLKIPEGPPTDPASRKTQM